jgi:transcriptional regulator with XRE-family HTH domain
MENNLVSKVAELREKAHLTQRQLANRLDVTESTIANWERGRNGIKWFKMVADLCAALNCTPNDLFGYESPAADPTDPQE